MQNHEKVQKAAAFLRKKFRENNPSGQPPTIGFVLGTGLGGATGVMENVLEIEYASIPHFPTSTVASHSGAILHGRIHNTPVIALKGRFHLYEGYSPQEVAFGIRVLAELGVGVLIVTNAAGALNPRLRPGELMLVADQINFTGQTPLAGPNIEAWGPRFPDMSRVYSNRLNDLAMDAALTLRIRLESGIYIGVAGPQLETPAETRMLRLLGADAVGMSTIMETIAARHMNMEILGVSCLTNLNLPDCMDEVSLDDVIAMAGKAENNLASLLAAIIRNLKNS